jgi:hypothetical protein
MFGSCGRVETDWASQQVHVTEAERCAVGVVGVSVFTGAKKEVESKDEHVSGSEGGIRIGQVAEVRSMGYDGEWDGFDAMRRRVLFGVAFKLALKAEVEFARRLEPRVGISQCGQRLPNGTKGILHRSSSDWRPAGSQFSCPVATGKEAQQWDGVGGVDEIGVLL